MPLSKFSISDSLSADSGIDDLQNPKYNYTGNFDEEGFRDKYGCQIWDGIFQHKYAGYFLFNNMHNKGYYFIRQENGLCFYDGQFYNNKLEGYGQIMYNDGSIYEGLFKDNSRFGPGIVSHSDGTQDVGLWNSNTLIRLSISVSSDTVPTLCGTNKVKILRFRKIVPAFPKKTDLAKSLMEQIGADEDLQNKYPELYNHHVRNENSLFFDRRFYDLAQLGSEDALIDVLNYESPFDMELDESLLESDNCPCLNERCINLNKQLNEVDEELRKILELRIHYEKKLKKCEICCNKEFDQNTVIRYSPFIENEEQSQSLNDEMDSRNVVQNDSNQSSTINFTEFKYTGDVSLPANQLSGQAVSDEPKYETINNIFVNKMPFQSDQSVGETIEGPVAPIRVPNYTCTCIDEEIPDVDFLLAELERLKKKEIFFQKVIDFLNNVYFKEVIATRKSAISKTTKMLVEDLLAWNNEKVAIELLQHSFRYRNFETMLSFSVKSLLVGDRSQFGALGNLEKSCINFLTHCENNNLIGMRTAFMKHNINPDLSDARGNTGLHLATAKDCHEIIRQLANFGANLDVFNDECLTPLLLVILRMIAVTNGVMFGEKAFLPDIVLNPRELDEVLQWRPHESLVSLGEFMMSSTHTNLNDQAAQIKKSSEQIISKIRSQFRSMRLSSVSKINVDYLLSTSFVEDYERYKKAKALRIIDLVDERQLIPLQKTASVLLHYGANPNVGELPMKPILLAIFTRNADLVENMLVHNANPNVKNEDELSALHILASLPFSLENVHIAETFLNYLSDPNTVTNSNFWFSRNNELIGKSVISSFEDDECDGKTPLQLICMRKDFDEDNIEFQCAFVRTLLERGATCDQYYLGHTLLSLAVFRGNLELIETLFPYVDADQALGENMGNALTLLCLTRFNATKPFSQCKHIIDKLLVLGMNPFNPIYEFANIFEFLLYDSSEDIRYHIPKIRATLEAEYKHLKKQLLHSEGIEAASSSNKLLLAYMKEIGRKILMERYQYQGIQYLLEFAKEDLLQNKSMELIAKLFTVKEALDCIKLLVYNKKITLDDENKELLFKVLSFINSFSPKTKKPKKKKISGSQIPLNLEDEIANLEDNIEVPSNLKMYILDRNPKKYEVCFHCLRKTDKELLPCPYCNLVKFCSEECNKFNNKSNTKHFCKILFYNREKLNLQQYSDKVPSRGIDSMLQEARQLKEEETLVKIDKQLEDEENKISRKGRRKSDPLLQLEGKGKMQNSPKERIRKAQHTEHQLSTQTDGTAVVKSFDKGIEEEETSAKMIPLGHRKPSSIFNYDEPPLRKLNCGFHCGQIIPAVHLDDEGNIIREQAFCVCYPLYSTSSESQRNTSGVKPVLQTEEDSELYKRMSAGTSEVMKQSGLFGSAVKLEDSNIFHKILYDSSNQDSTLSVMEAKAQEQSEREKDKLKFSESSLETNKKESDVKKDDDEISQIVEDEEEEHVSSDENVKKKRKKKKKKSKSSRGSSRGAMKKKTKERKYGRRTREKQTQIDDSDRKREKRKRKEHKSVGGSSRADKETETKAETRRKRRLVKEKHTQMDDNMRDKKSRESSATGKRTGRKGERKKKKGSKSKRKHDKSMESDELKSEEEKKGRTTYLGIKRKAAQQRKEKEDGSLRSEQKQALREKKKAAKRKEKQSKSTESKTEEADESEEKRDRRRVSGKKKKEKQKEKREKSSGSEKKETKKRKEKSTESADSEDKGIKHQKEKRDKSSDRDRKEMKKQKGKEKRDKSSESDKKEKKKEKAKWDKIREKRTHHRTKQADESIEDDEERVGRFRTEQMTDRTVGEKKKKSQQKGKREKSAYSEEKQTKKKKEISDESSGSEDKRTKRQKGKRDKHLESGKQEAGQREEKRSVESKGKRIDEQKKKPDKTTDVKKKVGGKDKEERDRSVVSEKKKGQQKEKTKEKTVEKRSVDGKGKRAVQQRNEPDKTTDGKKKEVGKDKQKRDRSVVSEKKIEGQQKEKKSGKREEKQSLEPKEQRTGQLKRKPDKSTEDKKKELGQGKQKRDRSEVSESRKKEQQKDKREKSEDSEKKKTKKPIEKQERSVEGKKTGKHKETTEKIADSQKLAEQRKEKSGKGIDIDKKKTDYLNIQIVKEELTEEKRYNKNITQQGTTPLISKQEVREDVSVAQALSSMKALKKGLLNPEALLALSSDNLEEFRRISRGYQYFLELVSNYFPEFDMSCLLLPFACFIDGQFYYKFADPMPYFCRTYSTM